MAVKNINNPLGASFKLSLGSGLHDTNQIALPDGREVVAYIITTNVAGTLAVVDHLGNESLHILAVGDSVIGKYNLIKSTNTVTIVAADLTVHA